MKVRSFRGAICQGQIRYLAARRHRGSLQDTSSALKAPNDSGRGGIRSLNVALRQLLDLFVCLRPVQYFKGVPPRDTPRGRHGNLSRKHRRHYAGIEWAAGTAESEKVLDFLSKEFPKDFDKIRFGTKEKARSFGKKSAHQES